MFVCSVSNSIRIQGFSGGSDSEEFTCSAGDVGSLPQLERSLGEGNEQYSSLENSMDRGALKGYNPCGRKELGMSEQLSLHFKELS